MGIWKLNVAIGNFFQTTPKTSEPLLAVVPKSVSVHYFIVYLAKV